MKGIKYTYAGIGIMVISAALSIFGLYMQLDTGNDWYLLVGVTSGVLFREGYDTFKNS